MQEQKPKIVAEDIKEFERIQKEIEKLPPAVYHQIETARLGMLGIECEIRMNYGETQIALPWTTQLMISDEAIYAYCHSYFFRIPKEMKKYKLNFIFIDELNKEK